MAISNKHLKVFDYWVISAVALQIDDVDAVIHQFPDLTYEQLDRDFRSEDEFILNSNVVRSDLIRSLYARRVEKQD